MLPGRGRVSVGSGRASTTGDGGGTVTVVAPGSRRQPSSWKFIQERDQPESWRRLPRR